MTIKLSRSLNLVIPFDTEEGGKVYVHSTPISREVYEQYYWVLHQAFSSLFSSGMREIGGPSAAYLMLKDFAEQGKQWDTKVGVKEGLVNEIVRLTNVAYTGPNGWETLPLYSAFERGIFDADDRAEVMGQLVFFTLMARVGARKVSGLMQTMANGLYGSEATALSFTDYLVSLRTSTQGGTTSQSAPIPPAVPAVQAPAKALSIPH